MYQILQKFDIHWHDGGPSITMMYHLRRVSDLLCNWKSCLLCYMKDVVLHCSIFFKWNKLELELEFDLVNKSHLPIFNGRSISCTNIWVYCIHAITNKPIATGNIQPISSNSNPSLAIWWWDQRGKNARASSLTKTYQVISEPYDNVMSYKCFPHWVQYFVGSMMTSSNGNIFRVTDHLCGEFTGPRWIPRTKASDAELWCFLWSASE